MPLLTRRFQDGDIDFLYEAFIEAFSTNSTPIRLSREHFRIRIFSKLNILSEASFVTVNDQGRILAFNLHTVAEYEGKQTAYNGGIGVIPGFRNQGLATRTMEETILQMRGIQVARILLEVVTTNKPAINLYASRGFQSRRMLKSFKLGRIPETKSEALISVLSAIPEGDFDFEPAFIDSRNQLRYNLSNEHILGASVQEENAGFVVFQPHLGRVSQLFVRPKFRRLGLATQLLRTAQCKCNHALTFMNVPEDAEETLIALEKIGFRNELDQFEMELII